MNQRFLIHHVNTNDIYTIAVIRSPGAPITPLRLKVYMLDIIKIDINK